MSVNKHSILSTTYHLTAKDKQCLLDMKCKNVIFCLCFSAGTE